MQKTIIENVDNVLRLIERGILTKEEVREFLELKLKSPEKIEVNSKIYIKEDKD